MFEAVEYKGISAVDAGIDTIRVPVFLGRVNPLQEAHLELISSSIGFAQTNGTCALLLLGAGPGYKRDFNDPVSHETKSAFVLYKLQSRSYRGHILLQAPHSEYQLSAEQKRGIAVDTDYKWLHEDPDEKFRGDFAIMLKNNKYTALDISKFVETYVEKSGKYEPGKRYNVEIVQFAGGKDDDATKLKGTFEAAINHLHETGKFGDVTLLNPETPVGAIPSTPGGLDSKPLSATMVRECARKCFHDAGGGADDITSGLRCWQREFPFYATGAEFDIRPMYMEIIIDPKGVPYPIKKLVKSTQSTSVRAAPYRTGSKGGSRRKIKNLRYKRTIRKHHDRHQRRRSNRSIS